MAAPYTYPTPAMLSAQIAGNRGARGTATSIDAALVSNPAAAGGWRGLRQWLAITILGADAGNVLFAPQQPLQPMAQPIADGALGRPWDYPAGFNTRVTPRSGSPVSFPMLKALAEYDVLRVIIEHVKKELVSQTWSVGPVGKKAARDKRCDEVQAFLQSPDKDHGWADWLKMLLDQALIYDAPAIWLQPTRGGDLYALQILDGSLIQPKIMADGRLPPPELGPAYQQVIKGLPAVDYIKPVLRGRPVPVDPSGQPFPQLLYLPQTPRVDSPYGFSPVEQMIATIQIALKREEYLLSYYTQGSMPDLVFGVPETWNPSQIAEFDSWFNSIMSGNLVNRRRAQFVPNGVKPYDIREKALTDETDQHLVRVLCFCLGISPMPFIKMMNRASGEQHAEQQRSEGIEPLMQWVASVINAAIRVSFGYPDIVFGWEQEEATDPLEQAQIDKILTDTKAYHPDEIRVRRGDDAMPAALRAQMDDPLYVATPGGGFGKDGGEAVATSAPAVAGKLGKARAGSSGRSTRTGPRY